MIIEDGYGWFFDMIICWKENTYLLENGLFFYSPNIFGKCMFFLLLYFLDG